MKTFVAIISLIIVVESKTTWAAPSLFSENGHFYELVTTMRTWSEAKAAAETSSFQGYQGHLATISGPGESNFVRNLVLGNTAWIGGFQLPDAAEPRDGWGWITGEPFAYTAWAGGEPGQQHPDEDCMGIHGLANGRPGTWVDLPCSSTGQYVVEYEPNDFVIIQQFDPAANSGAWADFDNDGFDDLLTATIRQGNDYLYRNTRSAAPLALYQTITDGGRSSADCAWGDYDNDGAADFFLVAGPGTGYLYRNSPSGSLVQVLTNLFGLATTPGNSVVWLDYNNDGSLDLFITGPTNTLMLSDGIGGFTKASNASVVTDLGSASACNWVDYDNDRDFDLFVVRYGQPAALYRNDGEGQFTKVLTGALVGTSASSMGASWGDFDNDADMDVFIATENFQNDLFFRNDGFGVFTRVTSGIIPNDGARSFGSGWVDFDNDADLDLYVTMHNTLPKLYRNEGDGTFTLVVNTISTIQVQNNQGLTAVSWADYDNNGFMDLFVGHDYQSGGRLYRNKGNLNTWMKVRCVGNRSNRSAIGATVRVRARIGGVDRWQMRQITSQTGYKGHDSLIAHFGLGDAPVADIVRVEWPSGHVQEVKSISARRQITIIEDGGVPVIVNQPVHQTAHNGQDVSFAVTVQGIGPLSYQWRFNGQNIVQADQSVLTLRSVSAQHSGSYSVLVRNAFGSVLSQSATLAILADGAAGTEPEQLAVSLSPQKRPETDGLIVITHGWFVGGQLGEFAWVDEMAAAIRADLAKRSVNNYEVVPYKWDDKQRALLPPSVALITAGVLGALYGVDVATQGWEHIHIIGHSAGAAFVEGLAETVKAAAPSTTIHTTFLDPYSTIFPSTGKSLYGTNADWADCYYARDLTGSSTDGPLANAYNVDVTVVATAGSSHRYPYEFYKNSILGANPFCATSYGFPFSKEAGGWLARPSYTLQPVAACAVPLPTQRALPIALNSTISANQTLSAQSTRGVNITGNGFVLSTGIPETLSIRHLSVEATNDATWLALAVTVTNPANFVQFDATFTSGSTAEGLVTVYWNTNMIGFVDERVQGNVASNRFELPRTITNGVYSLSFRLNAFNETTSTLVVTNLALGFVGLSDPIKLAIRVADHDDTPTITISAAPNYNYVIETSSNLVNWAQAALLTSTNTTIQFQDEAANARSQRFYRARLE